MSAAKRFLWTEAACSTSEFILTFYGCLKRVASILYIGKIGADNIVWLLRKTKVVELSCTCRKILERDFSNTLLLHEILLS